MIDPGAGSGSILALDGSVVSMVSPLAFRLGSLPLALAGWKGFLNNWKGVPTWKNVSTWKTASPWKGFLNTWKGWSYLENWLYLEDCLCLKKVFSIPGRAGPILKTVSTWKTAVWKGYLNT
jgi:hypothetical protein